jgi:curved DNA-binding protein CbpA
LAISVEIALRRLQPEGSKEERTVADNISRGGARVLTSMTDLKPGDKVALREISGDFATEAIVRNNFTGPDGIPRLGLEFHGNTAPDRLVPTDGTKRTKRPMLTGPLARAAKPPTEATPATAAATPAAVSTGSAAAAEAAAEAAVVAAAAEAATAAEARREILALRESIGKMNHFEVLGIPRRSSGQDVKKAYFPLAKRYHPDASRDPALADLSKEISGIFVRVAEAYEVLSDTAKRARYEELLGPDRNRPITGPLFKLSASGPVPVADSAPPAAPPPPPPPETEERRLYRFEQALRKAKRCIAENQYWDAIQLLEPLLDEPVPARQSASVRLVLAQALAKNPKWLKRAEELLISVVRDDPGHVEAHFALAIVHRQAGLTARARNALRKVLDLSPGNEAALAELEALKSAPKDGKR